MQLRLPALAILLLALLTLSMPSRPATAAPADPPARPASALTCSDSPFSGVLELGREQEVYMGYTSAAEGPFGLGAFRFDGVHTPPAPPTAIAEDGLFVNGSDGRGTITDRAAAVADLNGDGRREFVQAFNDALGRSQLAVLGPDAQMPPDTQVSAFVDGPAVAGGRAMAAGRILGLADESEQVVVASRAPSGALVVQVYSGAADGSIAARAATFRTAALVSGQPLLTRVAVGNLDNDKYADIVVAYVQSGNFARRLLFLEYEPGLQAGSGDNLAQNLALRTTGTDSGATPAEQRLALADMNGDSLDEVVYATWADGNVTVVAVFRYDPTRGSGPQSVGLVRAANGQFNTGERPFAMATGDLDGLSGGVRQDEIVLAYYAQGGFNFGPGLHLQAIRLVGLGTPSPTLERIAYLGEDTDLRDVRQFLEVTIADLNGDNRGEIIAAFDDSERFGFTAGVLRLRSTPFPQLQLVSSGRYDPTLTAPITLAAGDTDNDSLRGVAQGLCRSLTEKHVTAAVFVPPFWERIQRDVAKSGSYGRSVASGSGVETSVTYTNGHSTSAYVGTGAGVSLFDIVELGATVRATSQREYSTSSTRGNQSTVETVRTTGIDFSESGVVYQPADYRCYSYQLSQGGAPIPTDEAGVRLCEYIPLPNAAAGVALAGSGLDSWDLNDGKSPEWTPVARDWASLTLFRGPAASQSSTAGAAAAANALDSGIVGGSYSAGPAAETLVQDYPWWQVDLGASRPIAKLRLWAPPGGLDNYVVLVSNTDFTAIPGHENPANLSSRPDVRAYTPADLLAAGALPADAAAGEVSSYLTLDAQGSAIAGRYVRVQRTDRAALRLAELQVFGRNHVDPDRYPVDVRDTTAGDGFFEVQLYNPFEANPNLAYPWVKVRGELSWSGKADDANIPLQLVGRGTGAASQWSWGLNKGATAFEADSTSTSSSVGVEFDVETGVIVKVQAGGSTSVSSGVTQETVLSTSWSSSFDVGGSVANFPREYNGAQSAWADACAYGYLPYFYTVTERSSVGFEHSYSVLDYLVPDGPASSLLNRRDDLSACRNGNLPSPTPNTSGDSTSVTMGGDLSLQVLANDAGNNLRITGVGAAANGQTSFTERSVRYTPRAGFSGQDSFSYTVADEQGQIATATVTVTVNRHTVSMPLTRR